SRRDELTCLAALPCPVLPLLAGVHVELAIAASAEQHPSPLICKRLSAALRALALFVDLHDLTPHSPWTPLKDGAAAVHGGTRPQPLARYLPANSFVSLFASSTSPTATARRSC